MSVSVSVCMSVLVRMPVLFRVPVLLRVRVLLTWAMATMVMVMRVIMVVMVVMLFMFHRVQIPSMLECLHAPQRWEKNARPENCHYYCGGTTDHNGGHQTEPRCRGSRLELS